MRLLYIGGRNLRDESIIMGKALFFDIDGTLVNFQGKMPDSTRNALRQIQKKGHKIVICSGRSLCQIYPWLLDMRFDGIIAASGAYVECDEQVIYERHMERKALVAARTLLELADACYAAQTKDGIVATESGKRRMWERFRSMGLKEDVADQVWKNMQIDEHLEQRCDIEKLNYFESQMSVAEIQEQLSEYCDVTAMSFELPTDDSGEISSRGINKALGIQKYIEHVGITRKDTIAFGDGPNDFDMIKYAWTGVAMGNALNALKKQADYVTTGIDEDGIEHALKELKLL